MTPAIRLLATLIALALAPVSAPALADTGRFVAISDVHLDPFAGDSSDARLLAADVADWPAILRERDEPPVSFGRDANVPLFLGVLEDAAAAAPDADFVVYPGDFVVHRLEERLAAIPDHDGDMADAAVKITLYLAARLEEAWPDAPILPALGNTDSGCGDYETEPGGAYLRGTFPMVERLAGDLLLPGAKESWLAGGYYAARHPTVADARVLVLNTVLWSTRYRNRCGAPEGEATPPGEAMLAWLRFQLYAARMDGERVLLVYHVPAGVDAYSTAHGHPGSKGCAPPMPFWQARYRNGFEGLIGEYAPMVLGALSGHIHRDSWRLFRDGKDAPIAVDTIVPSVSPIFGNAPAWQLFAYDRTTGALVDRTTRAVTNLEAASRGADIAIAELYRFTDAYRVPAYGLSALEGISEALATAVPSPDRTLYARFYGSGHGDDPEEAWPVYGCTPGNASVADFIACHCPAD